MLYAPSTEVHLLNVPLSLAQKHQLDFANATAQHSYFNSRHILNYSVFTDFSFQRKDNVIRVPVNVEYIAGCNYCMYQNSNFTGKWFYCFVTEKKYINDNCTELTIKTDVFQTYLFNYNFGGCFVERMHTRSDGLGEWTEPEPYNPASYPVSIAQTYVCTYYEQVIIVYFSKVPSSITGVNIIEQDSGALSMKYGKRYSWEGSSGQGFSTELDADLTALENAGQMDLISGVGTGSMLGAPITFNCKFTDDNFTTILKNNKSKLYCYGEIHGDSNYKLDIQTLHAESCDLRYRFVEGSSAFMVCEVLDVPGVVLQYSGFPAAQIPLNSDINQISKTIRSTIKTLPFTMLSAGLNAIPQIATGRAPSLSPMLQPVQNLIGAAAQYEISDMQPKQLSGVSPSNARFVSGDGGFYVIRYAPERQDLIAIDEFFTAYGYAVNRAIYPAFNTRSNHNYLKTSDCLIMPNSNADFIPAEDKEELENIFNGGVTVWHNPTTMGNYNVNNDPVS